MEQAGDNSVIEELKVQYLGRKSELSQILSNMGSLDSSLRPQVGKAVNILKQELSRAFASKEKTLDSSAGPTSEDDYDITLPAKKQTLGTTHPLNKVCKEICDIFEKIGFVVVQGPEIESEYNNFQALNIPLDHPSRDGFDTFYVNRKKGALLRSHTSPVQIRAMKQNKPPLAVIVPGKVYRPDATDASHSFMFNQIEGLLVGKNVSFANLKALLKLFARELFGKDIKMRFRPHFFPFTEPSAEVDISCRICKGKGCPSCGRKGWLEVLGAGMVHPNVFKAVGYNPHKYTGLAFGMGVDRIAMLKYGINDIRLFYENDLRFLRQFK